MATAINSEVITTLRRRLVDKLCKDNFFLINVIGYAIRKGKINYIDLMTEEEAKLLTQGK
jgi:hypothetical protein